VCVCVSLSLLFIKILLIPPICLSDLLQMHQKKIQFIKWKVWKIHSIIKPKEIHLSKDLDRFCLCPILMTLICRPQIQILPRSLHVSLWFDISFLIILIFINLSFSKFYVQPFSISHH